jgi:hypothetical protein
MAPVPFKVTVVTVEGAPSVQTLPESTVTADSVPLENCTAPRVVKLFAPVIVFVTAIASDPPFRVAAPETLRVPMVAAEVAVLVTVPVDTLTVSPLPEYPEKVSVAAPTATVPEFDIAPVFREPPKVRVPELTVSAPIVPVTVTDPVEVTAPPPDAADTVIVPLVPFNVAGPVPVYDEMVSPLTLFSEIVTAPALAKTAIVAAAPPEDRLRAPPEDCS